MAIVYHVSFSRLFVLTTTTKMYFYSFILIVFLLYTPVFRRAVANPLISMIFGRSLLLSVILKTVILNPGNSL